MLVPSPHRARISVGTLIALVVILAATWGWLRVPLVRPPDSLKMKRTAAPFLRSDVGDSFGEVPAMATKVLSVVLALAVRLVLRLGEDDGSVLSRALAVSLGILDPDLDDV